MAGERSFLLSHLLAAARVQHIIKAHEDTPNDPFHRVMRMGGGGVVG